MTGVKGQIHEKGVETRHAIVDATIELFGVRGSRSISLSDIAGACGVSRANVLHHFGSKDALLVEAMREHGRRGEQRLLQWASEGGIPFLEHLKEWGTYNQNNRSYVATYVALLAEAATPDSIPHGYYRRRLRSERRTFADALRQGQARGDIRRDLDCDALAGEIVAFFDGAAISWLIDPEAVDLEALYTAYLDGTIHRCRSTPA